MPALQLPPSETIAAPLAQSLEAPPEPAAPLLAVPTIEPAEKASIPLEPDISKLVAMAAGPNANATIDAGVAGGSANPKKDAKGKAKGKCSAKSKSAGKGKAGKGNAGKDKKGKGNAGKTHGKGSAKSKSAGKGKAGKGKDIGKGDASCKRKANGASAELLGCGKCRGSPKGCTQCRDPTFAGGRWQRK